jgi:hypothetical protein
MTSFENLKKSSDVMSSLTKQLNKLSEAPAREQNDDGFWKPELDKAGNGMAIIRFLPAPGVDGDDALPWVRVWSHGFKGPTGKWYIEKSLTTINQKDPVSEYNTRLWNMTDDDKSPERMQARQQKRKLSYYSNILVISDPKNRENEGKVFYYRYGEKIFKKITLMMNPEFEGDTPVNPFDLWKGANFKLRVKRVGEYINYDDSSFDSPSPLSDKEQYLKDIWEQEKSLLKFVDPSSFKSYDELKSRLYDVLGDLSTTPVKVEKPVPTAKPDKTISQNSIVDDDDDPDLKEFQNMAL